MAEIAEEVEATYAWGKDWLSAADALTAKAAGVNVCCGNAADIVESIRSFPAFDYVTDLQIAVHFGTGTHGHRLDVVNEIVEDIAPHLGWTPSGETERVSFRDVRIAKCSKTETFVTQVCRISIDPYKCLRCNDIHRPCPLVRVAPFAQADRNSGEHRISLPILIAVVREDDLTPTTANISPDQP
ncbi:hypothetical protein [Rhodococcus globerulus]|uniref:Uncharacterized protein n=1 Tax=Rhodococcus globerulus TaxID=33008 RepID=A0ABU4C6G0_RHOGO|nr:hypothetical protein [Rhodococcus globerulus]MDV6271793.1 hypothetical protein [Rhodococcus globerulus]